MYSIRLCRTSSMNVEYTRFYFEFRQLFFRLRDIHFVLLQLFELISLLIHRNPMEYQYEYVFDVQLTKISIENRRNLSIIDHSHGWDW